MSAEALWRFRVISIAAMLLMPHPGQYHLWHELLTYPRTGPVDRLFDRLEFLDAFASHHLPP